MAHLAKKSRITPVSHSIKAFSIATAVRRWILQNIFQILSAQHRYGRSGKKAQNRHRVVTPYLYHLTPTGPDVKLIRLSYKAPEIFWKLRHCDDPVLEIKYIYTHNLI